MKAENEEMEIALKKEIKELKHENDILRRKKGIEKTYNFWFI